MRLSIIPEEIRFPKGEVPVGARVVEWRGVGLYGRPLSVPVEVGLYGRSLGDCVARSFPLMEETLV